MVGDDEQHAAVHSSQYVRRVHHNISHVCFSCFMSPRLFSRSSYNLFCFVKPSSYSYHLDHYYTTVPLYYDLTKDI